MTAPRPGSTIDRAVRVLHASGPLPRAELARLIEREDDELDSLLRYGVRMGLLVRSNGDDDVSYALGDGVPVEVEARPAELPANEYTAQQGSQHVLKAEAARPDATDRDTPAIISPVGGPMGVGQAAAAAPQPSIALTPAEPQAPARWPSTVEAPADRAGLPQADPVDLRTDAYRPAPGSKTEALIAYLQKHAPHGGKAWLNARDLQAAGVPLSAVHAMLVTALKHGLVISRKDDGHLLFQAGAQSCGSAAPPPRAAPAPAAAAPVATPAPATPVGSTALSGDDLVSFLRAQLDTEIARLEHNLRMLRRRKEAFELALDGACTHSPSPQSGRAAWWSSVGFRTEVA